MVESETDCLLEIRDLFDPANRVNRWALMPAQRSGRLAGYFRHDI
jgi:hypothetical protein